MGNIWVMEFIPPSPPPPPLTPSWGAVCISTAGTVYERAAYYFIWKVCERVSRTSEEMTNKMVRDREIELEFEKSGKD